MVLLGLLPVCQFALLSSYRSSATRSGFKMKKTPASGMPTKVAEGISGIKKASPMVGRVHKRWVLVSRGPQVTATTTTSTTFGRVGRWSALES